MILLIDNYDSFSYNLCQLIGGIRPDIQVIRNDERTVEEIRTLAPDHLILSPGPGRPADAGICERAVAALAGEMPILGSAWAIRPSARPLAARYPTPRSLCTASSPESYWTGPVLSSRTCQRPSPPPATTPGRGGGDLAGLPPGHRPYRGRGGHGGPAPEVSRLRPAVPPGIHSDAPGRRHFKTFFGGITHD